MDVEFWLGVGLLSYQGSEGKRKQEGGAPKLRHILLRLLLLRLLPLLRFLVLPGFVAVAAAVARGRTYI